MRKKLSIIVVLTMLVIIVGRQYVEEVQASDDPLGNPKTGDASGYLDDIFAPYEATCSGNFEQLTQRVVDPDAKIAEHCGFGGVWMQFSYDCDPIDLCGKEMVGVVGVSSCLELHGKDMPARLTVCRLVDGKGRWISSEVDPRAYVGFPDN